jgi:hypothetical protein
VHIGKCAADEDGEGAPGGRSIHCILLIGFFGCIIYRKYPVKLKILIANNTNAEFNCIDYIC